MRCYLILFSLLLAIPLAAQQKEVPPLTWPRELAEGDYKVVLYQPQIDEQKGNLLTGRMAVSVETAPDNRVFGAIWYEALLRTDLEERLVYLEDLNITQTRFADKDEAEIRKLKEFIIGKVDQADVLLPLDQLLAELEEVARLEQMQDQLRHDPPQIIYRDQPAALISIDGQARWKETAVKGYDYLVNTPFFLVRETAESRYLLKGGENWYASDFLMRGWAPVNKVPRKIRKLAREVVNDNRGTDFPELEDAEAPLEIVVVTEPSELVQTRGAPDYGPVDSTDLLYVRNSQNDILLDVNTNQHYVLLAGRWYRSRTLENARWEFVPPEELPGDFSKIPEAEPVASIRVSVPGTPEAKNALLEQTIPQTATIDRKNASIEVNFDGAPQFEAIAGTDLLLAVNSDKTVLRAGSLYYAIDNGVWFSAPAPAGPWTVATQRPAGVEDIPPASPAYHTRYVYIYDYTPEVVYVGYLPGYTGSYIYNGVVVYGTGFDYRPWYGYYYYPRPVTWGFNVHYNPWSGWGFSYGFSYGWFSFGWHRYPYWWGPCGYRYGYRHGFRYGYTRGYWAGYYSGSQRTRVYGPRPAPYSNVYRNRTTGVRSSGISRPSQIRSTRPSTRPATRPARPSTRPSAPSRMPARPSTRPNNIYSDRSGNIYRRDQSGNWQRRSQGQWQPSRPSSREQLNRSYQQRSQGTRNYNRSQQVRPQTRPSAPRTAPRPSTRKKSGRSGGRG